MLSSQVITSDITESQTEVSELGYPLPAAPFDAAESRPLGGGKYVFPHHLAFSQLVNMVSRSYRWTHDEALRNSQYNAVAFRRDAVVMDALRSRQMPTAQLQWHLEPRDKSNKLHIEAATKNTQIIKEIPRFQSFKMQLLEALLYGRYGVQSAFEWDYSTGTRRLVVRDHRPINGDKLVFKYSGQVGILVHAQYPGTWQLTDRGRAHFFEPAEREQIVIHHHEPEDADFWEPELAGGVFGVGIRHRLYWIYFIRQKLLNWLLDYMETVGAKGFTIYYYEQGNDDSLKEVKSHIEARPDNNTLLMPRYRDGSKGGPGVERLEPGQAGSQMLVELVTEYFDGLIRHFILGQTLTSEPSSGGGIGDGTAELHSDTFSRIIKYDAINLQETLSTDLVTVLYKYNSPGIPPADFLFDLEKPNAKGLLEAAQIIYEMGGSVDEDELMEVAGLSKPEPGASILSNLPNTAPPTAVGAVPQGVPIAGPTGPMPSEPVRQSRPGRPVRYAAGDNQFTPGQQLLDNAATLTDTGPQSAPTPERRHIDAMIQHVANMTPQARQEREKKLVNKTAAAIATRKVALETGLTDTGNIEPNKMRSMQSAWNFFRAGSNLSPEVKAKPLETFAPATSAVQENTRQQLSPEARRLAIERNASHIEDPTEQLHYVNNLARLQADEDLLDSKAPDIIKSLNVFGALPPKATWKLLAELGAQKKEWYSSLIKPFNTLFNPTGQRPSDTYRAIHLISAMSPNRAVKDDLMGALDVLHAWHTVSKRAEDAGHPEMTHNPHFIDQMLTDLAAGHIPGVSEKPGTMVYEDPKTGEVEHIPGHAHEMMAAFRKSIVNLLSQPDNDDPEFWNNYIISEGKKTSEFGPNMLGLQNKATVDTHEGHIADIGNVLTAHFPQFAAGFTKTPGFNPRNKKSFIGQQLKNRHVYNAVVMMLRHTTEELQAEHPDEGWTVAKTQAATWSTVMMLGAMTAGMDPIKAVQTYSNKDLHGATDFMHLIRKNPDVRKRLRSYGFSQALDKLDKVHEPALQQSHPFWDRLDAGARSLLTRIGHATGWIYGQQHNTAAAAKKKYAEALEFPYGANVVRPKESEIPD